MSGSLGPVYVHAPTSCRRPDHHEAKRGKRRLSAQARQKVNLLRNKPQPQCAIRRRTGAGRPDLLAHRVERRRHVLNLLAGHRPCRHQGGSVHERGIRRSMGEVCPTSAGFGGPRRCSFLQRPPMDITAPNGARLHNPSRSPCAAETTDASRHRARHSRPARWLCRGQKATTQRRHRGNAPATPAVVHRGPIVRRQAMSVVRPHPPMLVPARLGSGTPSTMPATLRRACGRLGWLRACGSECSGLRWRPWRARLHQGQEASNGQTTIDSGRP